MILWLREVQPQIRDQHLERRVERPHDRVNEAIGYRIMGRELQFQKSL